MGEPARQLSDQLSYATAKETLRRVADALSQVLLGKRDKVEQALTCLVGGGHLLLEDVPGVGKTSLAEALARAFGLSFARIQFTSDLMPADILGAQIFKAQEATFELRKGPLFHQLVLADELNRAPPRTQSALLEAMAQGQVSLDGVTHPLPRPFAVVATQNPVDLAGTYPLPDSQLDRFLMRLSLGHPSAQVEQELAMTRTLADPVRAVEPSSSPQALSALQALASQCQVGDAVAAYAVRLAHATRQHPEVERGVSTRAVLALVGLAKAQALWSARSFVTPGDLRAVLLPAFGHRILLRSALGGAYSREEAAHLLEGLLRAVPEPK